MSRNKLREIEWQVFVHGTISDRKQFMENAVTHRKPLELSGSECNVITFSLSHHDPSS